MPYGVLTQKWFCQYAAVHCPVLHHCELSALLPTIPMQVVIYMGLAVLTWPALRPRLMLLWVVSGL